MAKFSARWVGRQPDSDLSLLAQVRDRSGDWQSLGSDDDHERPRAPDYVGPPGDQNVADALGRSLQRARLLAQTRELLSLLDRCEGMPHLALSEISDDELKKLTEARRIANQMSSSGLSLDQWLAKTLAHLSVCQQVRETIGWAEVTELIDQAWLKGKGFGPSTPVDIGALKGKLISEPVPRTSGPPNPASPGDPTISYAEAFDRVGQARFGNVWRLSPTDEDQIELEAGLWQASSASAYRSAEDKAKEIEWRRNWVDTWLAENGLIDPIRRQHGLEIQPIPGKKFEAAFSPVFGGSDVDLDLREELERTYEDRSAYVSAQQILATPWSPPEGLTLDQVDAVVGDEPRPFLASIVDLLAFGAPLPDKTRQLLGLLSQQKDWDSRAETCKVLAAEGYPVEKVAAARRRAAAALFEGARRADKSVLVGSSDRHDDRPIPPHYFDVPRNLGFEDNSIASDLAVLVDNPQWQKQFDAERENKPEPWLNVRVDFKWFMGWFTSQLIVPTGIAGLVRLPSRAGNFSIQVSATTSDRPLPVTGPEKAIELSVVSTRNREQTAAALNRSAGTLAAEEPEPKRNWNEYDEPHFRAMKQLLASGGALSRSDAARQVVATNEVAGAGTQESRQKRLERGYPKWLVLNSQQLLNSPD